MNDLIVLENINAVEVFSGNGLDDLLKQITEEAKSIVPDLTSKKGRDEIASMAYKVAKSKTYLDGCRKDLVAEWKTKAKAVDNEGKKMRDYLDNLKEEIRKPLTEWEQAEENRIKNHTDAIQWIINIGESASDFLQYDADVILGWLSELDSLEINENWEEFANDAAIAKDKALRQIKGAITKREAYDKEQAELAKLRAEAAEREQKDREEQLRKEGERRAKLEAEAKANNEKERVKRDAEKIEQEKQAAIQAQKDAELRAKQAEENAAKEAEAAVIREQERVEAGRIAEELAAKKREANKAHKTKINNAIVDALILAGLAKADAKKAVIAIATGKVPYTTISY